MGNPPLHFNQIDSNATQQNIQTGKSIIFTNMRDFDFHIQDQPLPRIQAESYPTSGERPSYQK